MKSGQARRKTQRRGDETRQRLIDATKLLLAEYDYPSLTLDRISTEVGISKSSVLWHFGSKEGLLTEAVFDLFAEVDQQLTVSKTSLSSLEGRLRFLFRTVAEYYQANTGAKGVSITLLFNSQVPTEIHQRLKDQWDDHLEKIRRFLSTESQLVSHDYAVGVMALLHGLYLQWHLNGCQPDLEERMERALLALITTE